MAQKNVLRKLMNLDNDKADQYLKNHAAELLSLIKASTNTDEIFDCLSELNEFVYKVPGVVIDIANHLVSNPNNYPTPLHEYDFGKFDGKTYEDILTKTLDLLNELRYVEFKGVFEMLNICYTNGSEQIKLKSLEIFKKQSEYNLYALKKIGYSVQRQVLDTLIQWSAEEKRSKSEIILTISRELLEPSFEGVSMTDEKTLTIQSGPLQATDFLRKIRRDTMNLLIELISLKESTEDRLKVLSVLNDVYKTPFEAYDDSVSEMIKEDVEYLVKYYEKLLLIDGPNLNSDLAIVLDVDRRLTWLSNPYNGNIPLIETLITRLREDSGYSLFRLLVGDILDHNEGDNWQDAEKRRHAEINNYFESLNSSSTEQLIIVFNQFASYKGVVDDWKFQEFNNLLTKIAEQKPEIADTLLDDAVSRNSELKKFSIEILSGFRKGNHVAIWDKYLDQITDKSDLELTTALCYSLISSAHENIRESDMDFLKGITNKDGRFAFIGELAERDRRYSHAFINALYYSYKKNPQLIQALIVKAITENPTYANNYIHELNFAQWRGNLDFEQWTEPNIQTLLAAIVDLPELDFHTQDTLVNLGKLKFDYITDVLLERIRRHESKEPKDLSVTKNRYDAIPYHLNQNLIEFISENVQYPDFIKTTIEQMTSGWSLFNFELGQLLREVGGPFNHVLTSIIRTGSDDSLHKAMQLIRSINSANIDICFEIVRQTDNREVWKEVESALFSTGVVSGEYGFAEAYEKRAEDAKRFLKDRNANARKFAEQLVKDFTDMAEHERIKAEEDIKKQKLEFEG